MWFTRLHKIPFSWKLFFWNPSVCLLYKWISTVCEDMLHFSKLLNRRKWDTELKRNRVPSAEKWTVGDLKKRCVKIGSLLNVSFWPCTVSVCKFCVILLMLVFVCVCAACLSEWQKGSKLAVRTCRLAGVALEEPWTSAAPDEDLGSAWNSVWFSTWSPRGSVQLCRDFDSVSFEGKQFKRRRFSSTASIVAYKNFRGDETHITIQYCL